MELLFLLLLVLIMAVALGSGYPVAFALPGAAIISISLAAACGYLFAGEVDAYFAQGGPGQWLSAGVTNLRGVYWEPERDTLIAIPLFIFMGIMLQRSKIAEDLLITMAQLFGPVPGGLGSSAADQAGTARKALYKENTGELSMPSVFDVGSTSAGEMFLGAFVPGIVLVILYMIYILVFAFFNPKAAPAVRYGDWCSRCIGNGWLSST